MTVQELLKSLDKKKFIKYYVEYSKKADCKADKVLVEHYFDQLLNIEVHEDANSIVFAVPCLESELLDSFIVYKKDLKKRRVETYGYEISKPSEVLGSCISNACRHYVDNDMKYAAAILWELSFFGYSLEAQEESSKKFVDEINTSVKEIKDGTANLKRIEDLFEELGYKDERTKQEKEFDLKVTTLTGKYHMKLLKELYKLELSY